MMAANPPRSKRQEATVTDIENGGHSSQATSSLDTTGVTSPEPISSNTRLSFDYTVVAHNETHAPIWWQRLRDRIPAPVARPARKAWKWIEGPQPPKSYQIKPFLKPVQTFPTRILSKLPKHARFVLRFLAFFLWVALFGVILAKFSLPNDIAGFGAPVRLSCINRLWPDAQSCSTDGRNCLPFDNSTFAFICPADCAGAQVLNPYTIGDEQINYRPLVVGGASDTAGGGDLAYRGDSFICGAAIHAGVLTDGRGGCGVLSLIGEKSSFGSIRRNGIESVGFNSSFPLSFGFNRDDAVTSVSGKCRDPRWNLLTLSTIFTALFSLFASHPASFFVPVFIIVYFQIAMASDPPYFSDYPSLASSALASFLPAAFVGAVIYRYIVRKTLKKLNAPFEKTILWIGGCWVGALSNLTLERIPLQRLTPHDIRQQPGGIIALVLIVLIIAGVAIYQAWCFRSEGRLPRYLGLYAILGLGLLILLAIPHLNLRIHHYILGLLLLPGTALQTRPSLLFQGLLVGLFINGIARWGFASILQTSAALQGDAQRGYAPPSILDPITNSNNITFAWDVLARGWDGVSVLVNDVERFRGFPEDGERNFTWTRKNLEHPEFFRFGYVRYLPFGSVSYSDFTRAGTWWPNGTWIDIPPGST